METLEIIHVIVTGDQGNLEHISWTRLCVAKAYERFKKKKPNNTH